MMVLYVMRLLAIPLCFVLFIKGFFPFKDISSGYSTKTISPSPSSFPSLSLSINGSGNSDVQVPNPLTPTTKSNISPPYKRLVLMIIDALRNDFVHGPFNYMPHTNFLLRRGHGMSFTAQTHPPTVTLPRIKAITTGAIPGFIDVVLNFGSTALMEDNIVTQMKINNRKVVFYGDDTWINLFPNHFHRHDGTTSFFVTDYTEVDNNVTRHLSSQLQPDVEWDVMILHYLGLDHIGHLSGPRSPLIRPKLVEMDGIINRVYSAMQTWESSNISSLLVICGDHGMSDQGGHGGSSPSEVLVPLVFLSPSIKTKESTNRGLVSQTDLCPTLAMLLGLPVPLNSLGKIITDTLVDYSLPQKISILHQNAHQVLKVFKTFVNDFERESAYTLYTTGLEKHKKWLTGQDFLTKEEWEKQGHHIQGLYSESLSLMAEKVGNLSSQYDVYVMTASMTLLWLLLLSLVVTLLRKDLTLPEPSLIKHLIQIVPILGSALMSHITMCTAGVSSTLICGSSQFSIGVQLVMACVLVSSMLHLACAWSRLLPWKQQIMHLVSGSTFIQSFLMLATVVHTLTLLSSSFVEEEHQTFYFLTTSIHVLLLGLISCRFLKSYKLFQGRNNNLNFCEGKEKYDGISIMKDSQHIKENDEADYVQSRDFNETRELNSCDDTETEIAGLCKDILDNDFQSSNSKDHFSEIDFNDKYNTKKDVHRHENAKTENSAFVERLNMITGRDALHMSVSLGVILVFLRVLRRWNQTGNKWLDVPDFGDWLVNPNNKPILSFAVVFSLMIVGASRGVAVSKLQAMFVNLSLAATYVSRAAGGSLIFPDRRFVSSRGVPEARLSYFFIGLTVLVSTLPLNQSEENDEMVGKTSSSKELKGRQKLINKTKNHVVNKEALENGDIQSNLEVNSTQGKNEVSLMQDVKDLISIRSDTHSSSLNLHDQRVHIVNGCLNAWLCFMCLVLRPHNIPVVAMMSLIEQMAVYVLIRLQLKPTSFLLYCLWMGQAFFFFQGNSNSISTIDVSAGYIGITEYNPSIIAILMALSTYSGLIFWMLSFLKVMCLLFPRKQSNRLGPELQVSFNGLALKMLFPLAVYCIVVSTQRYHLFVWTVFSPKLLYQAMETIVLSVVALCFYIVSFLVT